MTFEEYLEALKNQPKPELMLDFGLPVESAGVDPDEDVEVGEWEADI
jgi:hypothetical protein